MYLNIYTTFSKSVLHTSASENRRMSLGFSLSLAIPNACTYFVFLKFIARTILIFAT
jgi:hypothetical protein